LTRRPSGRRGNQKTTFLDKPGTSVVPGIHTELPGCVDSGRKLSF
jgi:hypothetical protein